MYPKLIFGNQFVKKVCPEIRDAKNSIDIIVFFWTMNLTDLNDPVTLLIRELQDALNRGVKIRILGNNDSVLLKLEQCGFETKHCYTSKLMHPKCMLIDNETAVIGSHNYTMSGLTFNMEISTIIKLNGQNNELSTFFNHLWGV